MLKEFNDPDLLSQLLYESFFLLNLANIDQFYRKSIAILVARFFNFGAKAQAQSPPQRIPVIVRCHIFFFLAFVNNYQTNQLADNLLIYYYLIYNFLIY